MYTALLFHSRCVRHTRFTKVKERVSPRRLSSLPSRPPASVLLPGLQYRRRSITSGVDRSRRRRQRGRAQNPLGNQSSTALLSHSLDQAEARPRRPSAFARPSDDGGLQRSANKSSSKRGRRELGHASMRPPRETRKRKCEVEKHVFPDAIQQVKTCELRQWLTFPLSSYHIT